jgi:hypothetical protein
MFNAALSDRVKKFQASASHALLPTRRMMSLLDCAAYEAYLSRGYSGRRLPSGQGACAGRQRLRSTYGDAQHPTGTLGFGNHSLDALVLTSVPILGTPATTVEVGL